MFTGIIETLGSVHGRPAGGRTLTVRCPAGFSRALRAGGSVSVNGACLTVAQKRAGRISFDLSGETLRRTTLASFKRGDRIHLELPLKRGARLGGHFVLGHVDARGRVLRALRAKNDLRLFIRFPRMLGPYLLEKGSVAVDGVSLTVGRVVKGAFWVHLVPHTLKNTRFSELKTGDKVNLEADILVKLLARLFRR